MTIYVRKEEEKVYNALMLENLTVDDLKEAVSSACNVQSKHTKHLAELFSILMLSAFEHIV